MINFLSRGYDQTMQTPARIANSANLNTLCAWQVSAVPRAYKKGDHLE